MLAQEQTKQVEAENDKAKESNRHAEAMQTQQAEILQVRVCVRLQRKQARLGGSDGRSSIKTITRSVRVCACK